MSQSNPQENDISSAPVVLFDGVCKLCNGSVNFILNRDREGRLKLASLQSDYVHKLIASHVLKPGWMDSILLLEGKRFSDKSTAIIRTTKYLGWTVAVMHGFSHCSPICPRLCI